MRFRSTRGNPLILMEFKVSVSKARQQPFRGYPGGTEHDDTLVQHVRQIAELRQRVRRTDFGLRAQLWFLNEAHERQDTVSPLR